MKKAARRVEHIQGCYTAHQGSGFFIKTRDRSLDFESAYVTVDGRERKVRFRKLACGCWRVSFPRGHKGDPSEIRLLKKTRRSR